MLRDRCRRCGPRSASSEPKLMTLVTISPGSKPKVAFLASASASAWDNPPCSSRLASHGITRSGRTLRSRSRNSASLIPLSSRRATRNWPSSGPRMNSTMLSMPKFGATWPDEAHRDLRCSRASPRARSPRGTSPPSAGSARSSSRAAAGTGARTAPSRSGGTARCRPASPASQRIRPHADEIDRDHDPPESDEPVHGLAINLEDPGEQPADPRRGARCA